MMNIAVLGSFFGDEAKARCVHYFSPEYRYICKFNGSNNAGHTVYVDGVKCVFNQVPSIDFRASHTMGFLGSGMVINLEALREELLNIQKMYPDASKRITIDPDAFIVSEKHIEEDKKKNGFIGTTGKGIGPAYTDKMARTGTKVRHLLDQNSEITEALKKMGVSFRYVMDMYNEFLCSEVMFEGAQGILLDLNAGTYPYVSCGDSTLAGIYSSGFGFIAPKVVYGAAKVYSTKVGAGPFPTEYFDEEAETLRKMGNEYGAVTGRPRRVGALDVPALVYAVRRGGLTNLILTKFDILNGLEKVKIAVKYDKPLLSGSDFESVKPYYEFVKGWDDPSDSDQIRSFVETIEQYTNLRVSYISFGTGPEEFQKWTS